MNETKKQVRLIEPPAVNLRKDSFLLSALTQESQFQSTSEFMSWFECRKRANPFLVSHIPFASLDQWYFEKTTQNLVHTSGKFFRIEGLRVSTNFGPVRQWDQPIINQPEVGILGIITKKFAGVRHLLMQAKMEPGNVNILQLSPTVQATKSNFTQVHKGKLPVYLEYFLDRTKSKFLVDQLQTEQGGRFLRKRNRNMIVEVDEDIQLHKDFCWLTLGQIKKLLTIDNFVNMDARSVLSCIPFVDENSKAYYDYLKKSNQIEAMGQGFNNFSGDLLTSMFESEYAYHSSEEIISWFTELKTKYELNVKQIPLNEVSQWTRTDKKIIHSSKRFFSVIAVSVQAGNREVFSWTQPLLKDTSYGLLSFITKKINGILHFLVQAKVEPGNIDVIEMAPTVSCSRIEFRYQQAGQPPFLEIFMKASPNQIKFSAIQSEEGGRFYQFQNRNMIVELDDSISLEIPENYIWMTLGQLMKFLKHGYLNIETRSLLSCMSLI